MILNLNFIFYVYDVFNVFFIPTSPDYLHNPKFVLLYLNLIITFYKIYIIPKNHKNNDFYE